MARIEITLIVVLFSLSTCAQKENNHKVDPAAVRLNNMAMELDIQNSDSASKAILFLDSATAIDSNYYLAYYNKLIFLNQLRQYNKAIIAINNLIRLQPYANVFYFNGGIIYEKIGDTISSRNYFQKSLAICTKVLDTMKVENRNYEMLVANKAVDLIMLGEKEEGNLLLIQVYENQTDKSQKAMALSFMNKSKSEIVEMITNPPTESGESTPEEVK
jgi:tetratricopeptide (TPR) repeat protein